MLVCQQRYVDLFLSPELEIYKDCATATSSN